MEIFLSYSHKDEKEKNKLLSHLGVLQKTGKINVWSDDQINAGADWQNDISIAISRADIAILLITADYLNSDFILNVEIPNFLKKRQQEGLIVFPIVAKACAWKQVDWLVKMNLRPKNGRPVWGNKNGNIDEDLATIANEIALVAQTAKNGQSQKTDHFSNNVQINYQFVSPYLPTEESLAKVIINFTCSKDIAPVRQTIKPLPIHMCLLLDVSGSMNSPEKYPLLREAIPQLIYALSGNDFLTIILFSISSETILFAEQISECRNKINSILEQIDNSGIIFGSSTLLSPGLQNAIEEISNFRSYTPKAINRLYILTDGEIHDADESIALNPSLKTLEAEINSYGFGKDFALETIKKITEGIPGSGKVKSILNTEEVAFVFRHIGDVAQRIFAYDAEFVFSYADNVIPGDAFSYQPDKKYIGQVDYESKQIKIKLPTLEINRIYTFMFEGVLPQLSDDRQSIQTFGNVLLKYKAIDKEETTTSTIVAQRSNDKRRIEYTNHNAHEIYQILDATRKDDSKSQLDALNAQLAIYKREGADPQTIMTIETAIHKIESGLALSDYEERQIGSTRKTQVENIEKTPSRQFVTKQRADSDIEDDIFSEFKDR